VKFLNSQGPKECEFYQGSVRVVGSAWPGVRYYWNLGAEFISQWVSR